MYGNGNSSRWRWRCTCRSPSCGRRETGRDSNAVGGAGFVGVAGKTGSYNSKAPPITPATASGHAASGRRLVQRFGRIGGSRTTGTRTSSDSHGCCCAFGVAVGVGVALVGARLAGDARWGGIAMASVAPGSSVSPARPAPTRAKHRRLHDRQQPACRAPAVASALQPRWRVAAKENGAKRPRFPSSCSFAATPQRNPVSLRAMTRRWISLVPS
jgi:hypothetical protein